MTLNLSLKYRIALIIFLLEAVMMVVVLQQSLGQSYEASSIQIKNNQTAVLELLAGISQQALITEEYAELQPYIKHTLSKTEAKHFILTDHTNTIVASSIHNEIGSQLIESQLEKSSYDWQLKKINTDTGFPGQLAIAFSDKALSSAYKKSREFGFGIALTGMIIIAAIGVLVGHLLTRQLSRITDIAQKVSAGLYEYRTGINSNDELGILAQTFDKMIQHFIDNRNDLSIALHNIQSREQQLIESEERFRQLAENINEVFWLGSPDWTEIYYVSPAYKKDWGRDPEELYKNPHAWIQAVHPDDRQQVIDDIPKQIDSQTEVINFREYRITKSDDSILNIKARAFPIRDNNGEVIRIAGIAENITERKNTEEGLRQAQKMDAIGKLTGGIAHDFNNMLGIILGYAELIEQLTQNDNTKIASFAHEIHHAGERGAQLTNKLLAFSRKRPTDTQVIDINNQLTELKQMLEKTLTVRIRLNYQLANNLWPVNIDEADFEDAIINLCINSMHAIIDRGSITIATSNEHLDKLDAGSHNLKPGDYVLLRITDTGAGMDTETLEQAFIPFFTTKGDDGTGLGLSQVYGFMDRCEGNIKIYSELNHGTRISLYFPRYTGSMTTDIRKQEEKATSVQGTEKILIVDDEDGLLYYAKEILTQSGYTVLTANSAEEALKQLEQEAVDILFTDIIMPNMDGFELASIVKEKYPKIKIQLASGFSDNHNSEKVDETLKENILPKPYNSQTLLNTIQKLLK